ncbi:MULTISPECIES: zinc-binding dehydrogenase [unclassified Saccharopolyspora]|uniref:zinc-binding dehydrogenase n=1 Tax=unclassified Saccharopolyspora TaxID=2646250 RepID=UPI001CD3524C|nr:MULTISPECIES: zinc-binding dehydrogenase [unclassified Saccharopolyspora]MCA1188012.1 zinc-binding dehydrogenase [Saccharopolyspora sp. 6T]MCA1194452.1 zinc-binding dehydrogenase [Saccharopolyspora sp. 6V]MCA1229324.1 zinc-binding dehydrogenase [Saccharopolyspora sp. 6M]MCA1282467.1 zinc-binding dehydrogenase [Saccharopolyspora sp. 7B]
MPAVLDRPVPATMRAVRFDAATGELAVRDVPVPQPGPGEVLVRVAACGICQSDLSQLDGHIRPRLPEITPGHEAAGVVAALGAGVRNRQLGDRVVIAAGKDCGECPECLLGGGTDRCEDLQVLAFHYDGAWAEYVLTSAVSLVDVPESVPLEHAAVLADAVSTPYGALDTAQLRPAESVGVWGLGGIGTHLVQLARICGASPIIALDPLESARERAIGLGADFALDPGDPDVAARIAEITGGRGLRAAFDCVGRSATFTQADAALGHRGRLVLVGISPDRLAVGPEIHFVRNRHTVIGHTGYRMRHLEDLVELTDRGRLDVSGSVSAVLPLDEVAEGIRRLREHEGDPIRILLRP